MDRMRAWVNMLFIDHGVFRMVYGNLGQVSAELWRSAQPTPGQVARFARAGGRTIVNVRGGREHGSWPLEREACQRHGIKLVDFVLRSREAPDRATLLTTAKFLEQLEYPALVHCKSGADRAGLFAALYLILRRGASAAEARRQLTFRFGHFRYAKTGILDAFLDAYEREGEANGIPFLEWVERVYDPEALTRAFRPRLLSTIIADRLFRRE